MLDGSEAEHPAGVGGEHPQAPAQVGPLANARLETICKIVFKGNIGNSPLCKTVDKSLVVDRP